MFQESPSTVPDSDGSVQNETLKLQPPPLTKRPRRTRIHELSISVSRGPVQAGSSISTEEELSFCARKRRTTQQKSGAFVTVTGMHITAAVESSSLEAGHLHPQFTSHVEKAEGVEWNSNSRYIVVGIMGNEGSIPREILLPVVTDKDLFKQMHKAERKLRSLFRRLFSLKRVGGFGIYKCHPSQDYHSNPEISNETKRCLVELYRNYRTEKRDCNDRWNNWIHQNFNNSSLNPEEGVYALQLLLRWSPLKLVVWASVPTIFSLVIGLWYMISPHPGEDYVAVIQTGWTIASYIITTAARK